MQMKDDDAGPTGDDDNCGTYTFNGDDVGLSILTSGSHQVEISITHPVISYTFYDTITVYPPVTTPDIAITGETIFCEGDSVILDATIIDGVNYQWYKNEDEIPGADSTSYIVLETGVYSLTVTGVGGCYANSTETSIEVFENPAPPAIVVLGNVLTTTSVWEIQWYYNGSPIPGATLTSYFPAVEGVYQAVAINGPCEAWSAELNFIFQPVEEIYLNDFNIFPNPNTGIFMYEFTILQSQNIQIKIQNILGEEISINNYSNMSGLITKEMILINKPEGIYFLNIKGENFNKTQKFIVE